MKKDPASPAETVVPPATAQANATAQAKPRPAARALRAVDRGTIAVAGIAVLIVAALAYPRHPSAPGTDDDAAASQPAAVAASTVAPRDVSAPSKKTPAPRPQKSRIAESTKSAMPLAAVKPVAESASAENTAPKASGHDASARSAAAVEPTGTAGIAPITITGCLEVSVDHDEFRLTDTDGVDAPTSRSWKSGFLKKRPATVALLEPPARLALETHVGRRVTATGLLAGHDLKVSALRAVGPPCD